MKRIILFLATNIAILLVLGITLQLLGVESLLDEQGVGLNMQALLIYALVFGMGGSFISLGMSKWIAKRMTGAQVIEQPSTEAEAWLMETVRRLAQTSGIGMPEVAIFDSPEPNAFATGARRDSRAICCEPAPWWPYPCAFATPSMPPASWRWASPCQRPRVLATSAWVLWRSRHC
jgi:heat shock protein HtpX